MNILMVCLGNICRSPLAEGILAHKLSETNHFIDSAGTGAWHVGQLPDKRSIAVAKENGVDITNQRARQFEWHDFDRFDLIFVMDLSNYKDLIKLAKNQNQKDKVKLILKEFNAPIDEVPDPFYGENEDFRYVYALLDQATNHVIKNHNLLP